MKSRLIISFLFAVSFAMDTFAQFRDTEHWVSARKNEGDNLTTFNANYIPPKLNFTSDSSPLEDTAKINSLSTFISIPNKNDFSNKSNANCCNGRSITPTSESDLSQKDVKLLEDEVAAAIKWKNDFVFWATKGQEFSFANQFEKGNECYEKAYLLRLDEGIYSKNKVDESFDELHEVLMLLYMKTLNYLELGDLEGAMVECKRMDEWLKPRNANDTARRLIAKDPLFNVVMGLIFGLENEYDNASISFHKAEHLFENEYKGFLSKAEPEQIKASLVEADQLSSTFEQGFRSTEKNFGQLIFIWNNGQCPTELIKGEAFKLKVYEENYYTTDSSIKTFIDCIGDTLFSFYQFSNPIYNSCTLRQNGNVIKCELLEDQSWFMVHLLQERLRIRMKHIWHHGMNWNTLPGNIHFAIIPLLSGENHFSFLIHGDHGIEKTETFNFKGDGKFHFHMMNTLESIRLKVNGPEIINANNWWNGN